MRKPNGDEWHFLGNYDERQIALDHWKSMANLLASWKVTARFGVHYEPLPNERAELHLVDRAPDEPLPFVGDDLARLWRHVAA